ncbi:neural cell adhesion molecule L1.2 isoform X2 [Polypterus senegalus]|uniref:neural cell adhesion molecule L1.2 isoform X2 n=1 Tax=Polypterus senegalus TaxID=55291 RepID=UPI00196436D0|nr:neural cell adhesion molecule L1.2 isoform X2 [Polypterus senegalus]
MKKSRKGGVMAQSGVACAFILNFFMNLQRAHGTLQFPTDYKMDGLEKPPIITEQSPETLIVYSSDDVIVKCEAMGNPKPEFRWTKDGHFFDISAESRLRMSKDSGTFSMISNGNGVGGIKHYQGKYRCYAANTLGTAISTEITLIAESPPKWQKEVIVPVEEEEGESVVLPCNPPNSTAPPIIHWMGRNLRHINENERVTQSRDGNLYFSNVVESDSRDDYICHAQFIGARTIVQKEAIQLKVNPTNSVRNRKPHFLVPKGEKSSYLALRGQTLELECIVEGLPTPTMQWVWKDGEMSKERMIQEKYNKLLSIKNITEADDGEYQCIATNIEGTIKHTYTVTVEAAPYWIKKPLSGIYGPGENVGLDCVAEGTPKPQIMWKINGYPIKDIDPDKKRTVKEKSLILYSVAPGDTAVYQCEATNKHGSILSNAYVYVIKLPPQILTPDGKTYVVAEEMTVDLHCEAFGSPRPTISWRLEGNGEGHIMASSHYKIFPNGTLQISNASKEDSGLYKCSANNTEDESSISATVIVRSKTIIIERPQDLKVKVGGTVQFNCIAKFDPEFDSQQIIWKWNGQKIMESPFDDKYEIDDNLLIVNNVETKDQGIYTCMAVTGLDYDEAKGSLVVMDRPEPPTKLELSDEQARSVTLSWSPSKDNNSPIKEYLIEFQDPFAPSVYHELKKVDGKTTVAKLDLAGFVEYYFRVIAVNEVGSSIPSSLTDPYKTDKAAPDRNPNGVKGEGKEPYNMVIQWKPIKNLEWNAPDFRYKVSWRQRKDMDHDWHHIYTGESHYTVTNTSVFTAYEIRVQSVNEMGEGPEPRTYIGYSGEDDPEKAPENIGIILLNGSEVKVTWMPVPPESIRGHLLGYKIRCQRKHHLPGEPHRKQIVVDVQGNKNHAIVSGLDPFTDYELDMRVFNNKGGGPVSEAKEFKSAEGVPGPPASLHIESPSESVINLHWQPPAKPNGILLGYRLQYQQFNDSTNGLLEDHLIEDGNLMNYTLTEMDPKSIYRFYLRALTSVGEGPPIVREGATVIEGALPTLENISTFAGKTYANVSWETREGYRNVEFQIHYLNKNVKEAMKILEKVNSTQSFLQIKDLEPGTMYRILFVVKNRTIDVPFWETEIQTDGPALSEIHGGFATQGWFIGLISAIVLLLLILLLICFIKRNKGGKYSVKDKEDAHVDSEARPMKDETFGEYSDNEEKQYTGSQPSLNGDIKALGSDDSLADYGGSVDVQFNEDGSFIGQYSGKKEPNIIGGHDSSGATSPVNPNGIIPPPVMVALE